QSVGVRRFCGMRSGPRAVRPPQTNRSRARGVFDGHAGSFRRSSEHVSPDTKGDVMRLQDQVAVITGGAQGIGKAMATLFASEGAKLVLSDIDEAMVQATATQIGKEKNVETLGVKGDVSQFTDCEKLVDASLDKFSRIDILINNAGITRDNLLMRMSDDEWDAVIAVNLKGVFNCTKAVIRPMMKARQGRIVNIASVVGQMGNAGQANYSAS